MTLLPMISAGILQEFRRFRDADSNDCIYYPSLNESGLGPGWGN